MLTSNLIVSVILFFIQPVFIMGLLYTLWNRRKRVSYFRKKFRVNFNPDYFEVKDFFLKGLLPGLLISVLALVVGIPLTIEWYLMYQVITILLLVVSGYRFIQPVFTFSLTSIVFTGLDFLNINLPFHHISNLVEQDFFVFSQTSSQLPTIFTNILFFMAIILFLTTFSMEPKEDDKVYPILRNSQRGKTVAKYQKKSLWVLPMFVIVPGHVLPPLFNWWPVFSFGEMEYALLLLPILVGYHFTVSTQLLEEATIKLRDDMRILAGITFALFIFTYFIPAFSIWAIGMMLIGAAFVLYRHRKRENLWTFKYGPVDQGLRIIAVRDESPAERMNLAIGDTILNLNNLEVSNRTEFTHALAGKQSYVKLRIKRKDGEILIVETPIYDNDFNNLGLILLDQ